jgi:hypothetical protein
MEEIDRDRLVREYQRLKRQMMRNGLEPVVMDEGLLDGFTDLELIMLVKDCSRRLMIIHRMET